MQGDELPNLTRRSDSTHADPRVPPLESPAWLIHMNHRIRTLQHPETDGDIVSHTVVVLASAIASAAPDTDGGRRYRARIANVRSWATESGLSSDSIFPPEPIDVFLGVPATGSKPNGPGANHTTSVRPARVEAYP